MQAIRATQPPQAKGSITVWSWNIAAKSLQSLIPQYRHVAPNVHVDIDMTGARMQTRFMLSLAAHTGAPDVSQLLNTDVPHYVDTEQLTDLSPVAARYQDNFPPWVMQNCMRGGHIYAIPWDIGPCALFYRRDLFARYEIDPASIHTWDDYVRIGKVLLRNSHGHTKMLSMGAATLEPFYEMLMQESGGQIFDERGRIVIDSPQNRAALDMMRTICSSGIAAPYDQFSQEWLSGLTEDTVASYPGAVWLAGTIRDTAGLAGSGKWGVLRLPAMRSGGLHVANWGGSVLVIPLQTANKEAAWSFVEYALCTRAGQLAQYRSSELYPAFLPALSDVAMNEPDPFFGNQRIGRFFAEGVSDIQGLHLTPSWAEATTYLGQDLSHWAAAGTPESGAMLNRIAQKLHLRLNVPIAVSPGSDVHAMLHHE